MEEARAEKCSSDNFWWNAEICYGTERNCALRRNPCNRYGNLYALHVSYIVIEIKLDNCAEEYNTFTLLFADDFDPSIQAPGALQSVLSVSGTTARVSMYRTRLAALNLGQPKLSEAWNIRQLVPPTHVGSERSSLLQHVYSFIQLDYDLCCMSGRLHCIHCISAAV